MHNLSRPSSHWSTTNFLGKTEMQLLCCIDVFGEVNDSPSGCLDSATKYGTLVLDDEVPQTWSSSCEHERAVFRMHAHNQITARMMHWMVMTTGKISAPFRTKWVLLREFSNKFIFCNVSSMDPSANGALMSVTAMGPKVLLQWAHMCLLMDLHHNCRSNLFEKCHWHQPA